ncbi:MAG: EAL domain-containing protein [Burkholderiaceae bacterium]|nr:EAL domain-containing protein [Burkholderiaceae bacterium]
MFATFGLQNIHEHYERQAEIQTQNLAQAIDQSISNSTDKINQSLRAVAYEAELQLASGKRNLAILEGVIALQKKLLPEAIGFRILDANGDTLLGHAGTPNPEANIANREYFVHLKQHPGASTAISKPLLSRYTGDHVIAYAHRINYPDGSFAGAAVIPISLAYFRQIASKYVLGDHGVIMLRDIDHGLVLRTPPNSDDKKIDTEDNTLTDELKALLASGATSGTYRARTFSDGLMRTFSFRRLENSPLYVISGLAEQDYLTRWYRDVWEVLAFLVLFVIVTSASAWLIYRTWKQQLQGTKILQENHQSLKTLLQKLQESDHALRKTQEIGKLGSFKLDITRGLFSCSAEVDSLFGIDANHPHHFEAFLKLLHPEDRQRLLDAFHENVLKKKQFAEHEYRIIRSCDGAIRWLRVTGTIELNEQQHPVALSGIACDITEQKRYNEQLQLTNEVFINMHEAVVIADGNANIIDVNPAFTSMTGYSREEVIGKHYQSIQFYQQEKDYFRNVQETLIKNGYWEGEFKTERKDGTTYIQTAKISAIRDARGRLIRFIKVGYDVTQLRTSQRQIEHLAFHDKLTNLPNRAKLAECLKEAIDQAETSHKLLGVCYIDLDGFKQINDFWGHDVGDEVLVEVATRLQSCVGTADTVSRLGGDEFVVLLNGSSSINEIERTLRRMLSALSGPLTISHQEAELTASIGVAIYPDDVEDADVLIRRADQAMYIAKRMGKNRFHLFDSATDRRLRAHHDLFQSVTAALENNEFWLYYQPKVDMPSGKVIGAEALIRWQHPKRGLLLPGEFLPVVENTNFSIRLGEWVITEALYQMAEWSASGLNLPVSVNISGHHLQQPDFVERLATLLKKYPEVKPQWLQLEILETTAMENVDVVSNIIADCIDLGVSFALDDFGTGYSSLTYFRRLPTSMMKIDRSFVRDMLSDAEDYALIESIVKLAHSFQREVIAEGVETVEHGLSLMGIGCRLAQGYGIARPMPPGEIPFWLDEWNAPHEWQEMGEGLHQSIPHG